MSGLVQDHRQGQLSTVIGPTGLLLLEFAGEDRLSGLFDYRVEAISERGNISPDERIGTHATVLLDTSSTAVIPYDGLVTEFGWLRTETVGHRYWMRLRPWFWVASQRRNQRIFHDKTVVEILEELLAPYAAMSTPHLDTSGLGDYPKLEYTVQFRESDMDFARRQMERFGISYHFLHAAGAHTMVLTDTAEDHKGLPGGPHEIKTYDGQFNTGEEYLWEWRPEGRLATGAMRLIDYNFKTPSAGMETELADKVPHEHGGIESFDWPGDYLDKGTGKTVIDRRLKAERGAMARFRAQGNVTELAAGRRITLKGDEFTKEDGRGFLCVLARHRFLSDSYASGEVSNEGYGYVGSYSLIPETAPFAPERTAPQALVNGPQTAVVVGDGEIDCDEYGRILVRFHWDLEEAYSMRCRVSQNWASKGWGGMVIPRIGMEVVVEFLDGDPDKPLVTGCVYNGNNMPAYDLPAHKTKSVFRTDTHQGTGYNELVFEDEAGQEMISLYAQKDQTLKVLNNRAKRVDNDQVESVGSNKSIEVGGNHKETIGGSMSLSVGGKGWGLFGAIAGIAAAGGADASAGAAAVGDSSITGFVGGLASAGAAAAAMAGQGAAAFAGSVAGGKVSGRAQAGAASALGQLLGTALPISGVKATVVEKFVTDTVGLARTEQIGAYKNTSVGHTMTVHVGKEFIINCGKSKFVMDSDGNVTIIGTKFNFTASGNVQINGKVIDLN